MNPHLLLNGSKGRMGQAILHAAKSRNIAIVHTLDAEDNPESVTGDFHAAIDFSIQEATLPLARWLAARGKPLVIGTTGHPQATRENILALAKDIPIVWSGNYSIGVNLLNFLVNKAATVLGREYQPEVIELHHRHKRDAPSGTAERLVEILRQARALSPEQVRHGRQGLTGERPDEEIGVHAVRGGDIVGEHTVLFAGPGERLELTHKASDRRIFAEGALRAAIWAVGKAPGLYSMEDVLGLEIPRQP